MIARETLLREIERLRGEPIRRYVRDPGLWAAYDDVYDAVVYVKNPLVSVLVSTYNQEEYIRGCLEAIVSQTCDFEYEVVIAEDCSTDGTYGICREFQRRYPDRVRLLHNTVNQYKTGINWRRALSLMRGKYVAICEGDDYWCNPRKLQLQADAFARDDGLVICYADAYVKYPNSDELVGPELARAGYFDVCRGFSLSDNVCERFTTRTGAWYKTATVMCTKDYLCWYHERGLGSFCMTEVLQSLRMTAPTRGRIACILDVCAVYRGGVGVGTKAAADGVRVMIEGLYSRVYIAWDYMTDSEKRMLLLMTICQLLISKYNAPDYNRRVYEFLLLNLFNLPISKSLIRCAVYLVWRVLWLPHSRLPRRLRRRTD